MLGVHICPDSQYAELLHKCHHLDFGQDLAQIYSPMAVGPQELLLPNHHPEYPMLPLAIRVIDCDYVALHVIE
jgi:hypothetical protein